MDRRTDPGHGASARELARDAASADAASCILRRDSILVQQSPVGYFCIGFGEAARTLRFVFDDGPEARRAFGDTAHLATALDLHDIVAAPVIGSAATFAKGGDLYLSRLAALASLAKSGGYDPDEPRDDHGRWTSEGGGVNDGSPPAHLFHQISAILAATARDDTASESIPNSDPAGRNGRGDLYACVENDPFNLADPLGTSSGPGAAATCSEPSNRDAEQSSSGGLTNASFAVGGVTFVFDSTLGNDAGERLRKYAESQGREWFGNVEVAPDGTPFYSGPLHLTEGRPDLGNTEIHQIWEVKAEGREYAALRQVYDYSLSTATGLFDPPKYRVAAAAPSFFSGSTFSLPGEFGIINYRFLSGGVITYTYKTDSSVVRVPNFLPLPGAASLELPGPVIP